MRDIVRIFGEGLSGGGGKRGRQTEPGAEICKSIWRAGGCSWGENRELEGDMGSAPRESRELGRQEGGAKMHPPSISSTRLIVKNGTKGRAWHVCEKRAPVNGSHHGDFAS